MTTKKIQDSTQEVIYALKDIQVSIERATLKLEEINALLSQVETEAIVNLEQWAKVHGHKHQLELIRALPPAIFNNLGMSEFQGQRENILRGAYEELYLKDCGLDWCKSSYPWAKEFENLSTHPARDYCYRVLSKLPGFKSLLSFEKPTSPYRMAETDLELAMAENNGLIPEDRPVYFITWVAYELLFGKYIFGDSASCTRPSATTDR